MVSLAAAMLAAAASAQFRLSTWNVTFYSGGRTEAFQTAIYGEFEGRRYAPDVIVGQEFMTAAAVDEFRQMLNSAIGSPGDWASAPFVNGPDTDSAFFYRTSRVELLDTVIAAVGGGGTTQPPRNTMRYDFRLQGYTSEAATMSCYSVHMKAGSSTSDQSRRALEVQRILDNLETLPAGRQIAIAGDFNIQSAGQAAYVGLIGSPSKPGPFYDPINAGGTWDNNGFFRIIHTQDPSTQMDSRYDQILLGASLIDGKGWDYIGNPIYTYSGDYWNDPNHSYRAWGNDGSTYNMPLATASNTMVGQAIAEALILAANGGGHLPVFLDMRVPAKIKPSREAISFGKIPAGEPARIWLDIYDIGDRDRWGIAGVEPIEYTLEADGPVTIGPQTQPVWLRGRPFRHRIRLDPTEPGTLTGKITLSSNDPDRPVIEIPYSARVY